MLPCLDAGQVKASVETVDVHGQKVTGPWLIICELILIIKLGGIMSGSRNFRN